MVQWLNRRSSRTEEWDKVCHGRLDSGGKLGKGLVERRGEERIEGDREGKADGGPWCGPSRVKQHQPIISGKVVYFGSVGGDGIGWGMGWHKNILNSIGGVGPTSTNHHHNLKFPIWILHRDARGERRPSHDQTRVPSPLQSPLSRAFDTPKIERVFPNSCSDFVLLLINIFIFIIL